MSVATWPSELPRPTRSSYKAQNQDPRLKKNVASGPPGYRRRWSSVARLVSLQIIVPRDLKATFENFHEQTVQHGSVPFWMPDPVTDGWALLTQDGSPCLNNDGQPIVLGGQWLCLFGDTPPAETIIGIEFKIDFSVTVMP